MHVPSVAAYSYAGLYVPSGQYCAALRDVAAVALDHVSGGK